MGEFCVAILILKMEANKKHLLHIMLYYYKKSKNVTETHKKICAVYGGGAVTYWMCQKRFAKFHAGEFSLDTHHGRVDQLKLIGIKLRH